MNGISTILWDVGGVLLTNAWDRLQRDAVLTRFWLDHADFERRHLAIFEALERDEMTLDEYLSRTVFFESRSFTSAEFVDAMQQQSAVLGDSALGIVRQLAASEEYVLATVNNESRAMNEFRIGKFGLLDDFEAFFSSCYVGLRKPSRKIYEVALDVLQRHPEHAVFIDDRLENVAAAASLGMHAIRYEGSGSLSAQLVQLGIPITQNILD